MKKIIFIVLLCAAAVCLAGCGQRNEAAEALAQETAGAFADGDMDAIGRLVFGGDEYGAEELLSGIRGEDAGPREGVLAHIFARTAVRVKRVTGDTIEYEIEAPDMRDVFSGLEGDSAGLSEEELLRYMEDYAEHAETRVTAVSVGYTAAGGRVAADYRNETFINAVTGGLLDAYKSLYRQMLDEYAEGVN